MSAGGASTGIGSRREEVRIIIDAQPAKDVSRAIRKRTGSRSVPLLKELSSVGGIIADIVESIVRVDQPRVPEESVILRRRLGVASYMERRWPCPT